MRCSKYVVNIIMSYTRVGHKKPSPILFCLKFYCVCLYGQNDTSYKLPVCSAHTDIKT